MAQILSENLFIQRSNNKSGNLNKNKAYHKILLICPMVEKVPFFICVLSGKQY